MDKSTYPGSTQQSTVRGSGRHQTLSTSLSIISTASATAASLEVYAHIDANLCVIALEYVLTLLGSQSLLAIKDANLSQREKQLIKREISSELHDFHDYIKKRVLSSIEIRDPLQRKKYGVSVIRQNHDERRQVGVGGDRPSRLSIGSSRSDSMRVLVTRRQHLNVKQTSSAPPTSQQQPKSLRFDMTYDISGIGESPRALGGDLPSSTPAMQPKSCLKRGGHDDLPGEAKRRSEEDEPIFLEPDEPSPYHEWSYVNLVEEDYLHYLSNLFAYICQTE